VNTLEEWTVAACRQLGLDPAGIDRDLVLDLAREVAHGVARPAAPLSAYLLGLAVGRGADPAAAAAAVTGLARSWSGPEPAGPEPAGPEPAGPGQPAQAG
jgi:sirohydrochlorin ferrochelatase